MSGVINTRFLFDYNQIISDINLVQFEVDSNFE